jgi:delta-1-pyrroline-5-carboxylate synthetase
VWCPLRRATPVSLGSLISSRMYVPLVHLTFGSVVPDPNGIWIGQAAKLVRAGKEVIVVTSGAVGVGRMKLRKQSALKKSISDLTALNGHQDASNSAIPLGSELISYRSACAAAGQLELMSLYETLFSQWDIPTSQLLVTAFDFNCSERRANIRSVITQLLAVGIIPILNENDSVAANQGFQLYGDGFNDNDALATLISIEMRAHLTILLTDVLGVYDRPPLEPGAVIIDLYSSKNTFKEGQKSMNGRGGMGAKVEAALKAVQEGVLAALITSGKDFEMVDRIMRGENVGTLFLHSSRQDTHDGANATVANNEVNGAAAQSVSHIENSSTTTSTDPINNTDHDEQVQALAANVRAAGRILQQASSEVRARVLSYVADLLVERRSAIMEANGIDVAEAKDK